MAVERRALPTDAASGHGRFQALAQRARRLALAADPHREMAAPREDPDVSLQVRQKLDVDSRLVALYVVTQRGHGVGWRELRPHVAERIARAGSHDAEIRVQLAARRLQAPPRALPRHARQDRK